MSVSPSCCRLQRCHLPPLRQDIAKTCMQQFDDEDPAAHHRVSLHFLAEGTELRLHVRALAESGVCHPALAREVPGVEGKLS